MLDILTGLAASTGISAYQDYRSRKEASKNRNFQKKMSNTSHQREVADLKAAGLNPILSAGGGGASSPGGATATVSKPSITEVASARLMNEQRRGLALENEVQEEIKPVKKGVLNWAKNLFGKAQLPKGAWEEPLRGSTAKEIRAQNNTQDKRTILPAPAVTRFPVPVSKGNGANYDPSWRQGFLGIIENMLK